LEWVARAPASAESEIGLQHLGPRLMPTQAPIPESGAGAGAGSDSDSESDRHSSLLIRFIAALSSLAFIAAQSSFAFIAAQSSFAFIAEACKKSRRTCVAGSTKDCLQSEASKQSKRCRAYSGRCVGS
jgi:hypothetical protein